MLQHHLILISIYGNNTRPAENSNTLESNQSIEMCSNSLFNSNSPFLFSSNVNNNPHYSQKLNNTGKFTFANHSRVPNSIDSIESIKLTPEVQLAFSKFNKTLAEVDQIWKNRLDHLKQKAIQMCANMENDEVIKVMYEDDESKKYITQRLHEVLNDMWTSERETTILELTKQIGALNMK